MPAHAVAKIMQVLPSQQCARVCGVCVYGGSQTATIVNGDKGRTRGRAIPRVCGVRVQQQLSPSLFLLLIEPCLRGAQQVPCQQVAAAAR